VTPNVLYVSCRLERRWDVDREVLFTVRPAVRLALAAVTTFAVALPVLGSFSAPALAARAPHPGSPAIPSQAQVDKAKKDVAAKKLSVQQIEAQLAGAQARMEAASQAAEIAFEKYNGARWELQQAKLATRRAQAASAKAAYEVQAQRGGIVQLVTESYQNGTELNTATALMSDEGPAGLMNRYGVVQSAGDSMQAAYDRFKIASAKAKTYAARAAKAEKHQQSLAADAKQLAASAGQAAAEAGAVTSQIADQRQQLVQALAKAQNISVEIAGKRAKALERIAEQKAAEARRAKEEALQAALQKQAELAQKKAAAAKKHQPKNSDDSAAGDGGDSLPPVTSAPPPVANPAPNQTVAIQRTIAYAKAQLGRPYRWAAAGPSSFDCSGLTMQAWARGGKLLPHYSVAQFQQSTRISMVDAKAGDLLFWSSNGSPSGIHHVALYLGGGQFIEAPHTGANVRYNSIYNWYPDFVARP
jgi:cell wall-associated NlpC family hydrolase